MKLITKTTLSLLLFMSLTQFISAQTVGKGAWMIGGSAALDIEKYKDADESTTSFLLDPNVGYFFGDDFAAGLELYVNDSGIEGAETSFALAPFLRYYITNPIFIQVGAGFDLTENGGTVFGGKVGYSWFLNNGVAIEPALYFNSYNNDGDLNDFTSFGLSIGIQAFVNHDHGME